MKRRVLLASEIRDLLPPPRPANAHKRSFGRLQLVAGSARYPGAARLCALGAFKAGCGYVSLLSSAPLEVLVELPEVVTGFLPDADAYVVGPGLEESDELLALLEPLPPDKPLLLDAGALGLLPMMATRGRPLLLTPHEGEFARLLGVTGDEVRKDREAAIERARGRYPDATILLKGSPTLIAHGPTLWTMDRGSVAMATAGQGDLLAGVLGAYLALGISTERAALVGSYLCATAADELAKGAEPQGVLAHEVAAALPATLARLRA